jgi:alpha-L-rhamnosidase
MPKPISESDFPGVRWHGHWIWLPEEQVSPSGFWSATVEQQQVATHGLFRKAFALESVPERVPARLTADSRYILYVNGAEIGRGPIRSQPRRLYYDLYDLAHFLRPGENTIAVHVERFASANSFWMPPVPNNSLGVRGVLVFEADLAGTWLVSDGSWRTLKTDAWRPDWMDPSTHHQGVPLEAFDARLLAPDWAAPNYDDSAWGEAQVVPAMHIGGFRRTQPPTDPYGPLYPRPIAQLGGDHVTAVAVHVESLTGAVDTSNGSPMARVQAALSRTAVEAHDAPLPVSLDLPVGGGVRVTVDMGRIVSGLIELSVEAPAGTQFDLSCTEDPLQVSFTMDRMAAGARYVARGADDAFCYTHSIGLRYIYLLIHATAGRITLNHIGVRELLYPWEGDASFACNDAELNRIYAASRRTVHLNSHDAFTDCPTREQRAWVGDGVVHQMVHLATNADWRLARHFCTLGNSPRSDGILPMSVSGDIELANGFTIPDWSLHWIHGVHNLYRYLGDRDEIKAYMPTVERILRWYAPYQTEGGALRDVPEWNLVDWSSVSTEDTSSLLTALWARGLHEFAEMAGWLQERGSQRWAEPLYERACAGIEIFWSEARGSYVDHVVDGVQRPEMSQLAGALAIVSGLAPRERWARMLATITDPETLVMSAWTGDGHGGQSMEKWMGQVREGRYEIDWDPEREVVLAQPFMSYVVHDAVALGGAADRIPDLCRRWSQFLANGYDTLGECWDYGTHVHGWSSTPARDLVFYTLGVTPAEPGYGVARIAPRIGALRWLRGRAPTPRGMISVEMDARWLVIESPVEIILDMPGEAERAMPAGRHEIAIGQSGAAS